MYQTAKHNNIKIVIGFSIMTLLTACGGGGASGASGVVSQEQPLSDPIKASSVDFTPEVDLAPEVDFTPELAAGLTIDYADALDDGASGSSVGPNDDYINEQWNFMQTCLEISAQEPVVTVLNSKIETLANSDDVIRHIDGQILASSHVTDISASIQVHARDFDGSVGNVGHNMRSIMGRYLWLANSLPEGDYPYECAANG